MTTGHTEGAPPRSATAGIRAADEDLARWGAVGRTVNLGGPVHYADFGGPPDGPRVVLVHGLGGSHLNWCLLGPLLAGHARVLAVDLPGFGLTNPYGRSTTVSADARLVDRFVREVAGGPAVLIGNSMGGMVSILAAAAHPDSVSGLVLIDPALPLVAGVRPDLLIAVTFLMYAVPGVGERYLARRRATVAAPEMVRQVIELCCADSAAVPDDLVAASVEMVRRRAAVPGLEAAFLAAARSLLMVAGRRQRYWATMRAIRCPVLLIQGELDRLVSARAARAAAARNPNWSFTEFRGVGHVPQLEVPDGVASVVLNWLSRTGADATRAAPAAPAPATAGSTPPRATGSTPPRATGSTPPAGPAPTNSAGRAPVWAAGTTEPTPGQAGADPVPRPRDAPPAEQHASGG